MSDTELLAELKMQNGKISAEGSSLGLWMAQSRTGTLTFPDIGNACTHSSKWGLRCDGL
jgi:hypothetical protein